MTNQLSAFTFAPGLDLRTVMREGTPWFVAKDVCDALDLSDVTMSLAHLDSDERAKYNLGLRGLGASNIINESGLYSLILKSRKPEARAFKKWVTSVVLPAIRRDGAYVAGEEKVVTGEMSEDDLIAKALIAVHAKVTRLTTEKAALEAQVVSAAPAVAFHREFVEASGTQTLTEVAKGLGLAPRMLTMALIGDCVLYRRAKHATLLPAQ